MRIYQKKWFDAAERSNSLFIPADRGTGKTWFAKEYAKHRLKAGSVLLVTANADKVGKELPGVKVVSPTRLHQTSKNFSTIIFDDAIDASVKELIVFTAPDCKLIAIATEVIKSNCEVFKKFDRP